VKIPCKNCLMVPICRNKTYNYLMDQCVTLKDTVYIDEIHSNHLVIDKRRDKTDRMLSKLHNILNPPAWRLEYDEDRKRVKVMHIRKD